MQFDGRRIRFEVTYQLLQNFARRLNMPFDTAANEINVIELRGAKPVYGANAINSLNELETMIMDYDALHDYKTQIPRLFDTTWALVNDIMKENPLLYREVVPNERMNYLEFISTICQRIINSNNPTIQQFRQRAREIETEIDRLDLVNKRQRVISSRISDDRCQLELADNIVDRMNDSMILVWKDSLDNPHIRPLLINMDPGSHYIEYPMGNLPGAAVLAQGNYGATWTRHRGYPALSINKNGNPAFSGIRITGYHLDDAGTPTAAKLPGESDDHYFNRVGTRNIINTRSDDVITITEYTFTNIGGILVHAGPRPASLILNWSAGCTTMAGSTIGSNPANTYDEIFGDTEVALGDPNTWLGTDPGQNQATFNVIVWDAWSLYRLSQEARGGDAFKPNLQIGASDVTAELYPGENAEQWVLRMQRALNNRIDSIIAFNRPGNGIRNFFNRQRDQLHEDYPLFVPANMQFPDLARVGEDGIFGNGTASALRNFQLICFVLLGGGNVQLQLDNINSNELMWERNQWICGPETWKLLESETFNVIIEPLLDEQQFEQQLPQWPEFPPDPRNPLRPPWQEPERE